MAATSAARSAAQHAGDELHTAAVANTLAWADAAAARGDHHEALAWLQTIEAIGDELTPDYQTKRRAWLELTDGLPRHSSRSRAA